MSIFKIAWRSIQHRGFGSLLTILSMALGVMMVVAVLTIHGLVSQQFKNNSSFGYNMLVGARGGELQLTLNTVYYLSKPVENIPYEYYLAFCDEKTCADDLKHSISSTAHQLELESMRMCSSTAPGMGGFAGEVVSQVMEQLHDQKQTSSMRLNKGGLFSNYTHMAVPLCLGDYLEISKGVFPVDGRKIDENSSANYRCVGTKPSFFESLVLDLDTDKKFEFSEGRCFQELHPKHGYFECVVGGLIAKRHGIKIGDLINPTHGDPKSVNAHIHEQGFTVVGILEKTGTPHDRVVFLNIEGFYLMEDHAKPVEDDSLLKGNNKEDTLKVDPFEGEEDDDEDDDESSEKEDGARETNKESNSEQVSKKEVTKTSLNPTSQQDQSSNSTQSKPTTDEPVKTSSSWDMRTRLPIEQREVTSILVRTSLEDEYGMLPTILPSQIATGELETTLGWSEFRPVKAQKAAQAVNPVSAITSLFQLFVDPVRWLLLALTLMICVVSAISILVGIYNSMNQRRHEIAVMRALGANRPKVMWIMLTEALLLACAGGFLGWLAGHGLNAAISPIVEARTGVGIDFWNFAPGIPIFGYIPGTSGLLPEWLLEWRISPELLLIPGLMLLAVMVGIYPAISAYKTDVAQSLGK